MKTTFFEALEARAKAVGSLLCVGLDPHPEDLPEQTGDAARDFCLRLIEATSEVAVAYKPNAAFFEALGPDGFSALREVIAAVPDGIPVLLDAKRGDIASTARAYARAAFDRLGADAITVNAYMGWDAVEPFLAHPGKAVFVLCRTSNPSAAALQEIRVEGAGLQLFERVATMVEAHAESAGLVVGATSPSALAQVRDSAPTAWILAPGIGHQGGDLNATVKAGLRADGLGLLVPVSRGISRAEDPAKAARDIRNAIEDARAARSDAPGLSPKRAALAHALVDSGCVRFGTFTLKSGKISPIYIDLRRLISDPLLLQQAAAAFLPLLASLRFDHIAALPYAAMPIGTAISMMGGWPMIYPRKEAKAYGTKAAIEGVYETGQRTVLIDDLATTGGSKIEALEKLRGAGLETTDIVVLIDRQSGAKEAMTEAGCTLHAVFEFGELLDAWRASDRITETQLSAVRRFLEEG